MQTHFELTFAVVLAKGIRYNTLYAYSVFSRQWFSFKSARVIFLSGVQLSGFIHLCHVKTAIFDIVFWGLHIIVFFVFIENTNN